jgi:hypothetical protein
MDKRFLIRTRLLISFGVLLLLLLTIGMIGLQNTVTFAAASHGMYVDDLVPAVELSDAQAALFELRINDLTYPLVDAAGRSQLKTDDAGRLAAIDKNARAYALTYLTPTEEQAFQTWNAAYPPYLASRQQHLALHDAGQVAEANALRDGDLPATFAQAASAMRELIALQAQGGAETNNEVASRARLSTILLLASLTLAVLLGLGVAWWVTRTITSGLSARIQVGVANLAAAAAEIQAAVTQQAAGANEQSAAIVQTSSTVEEVRASAEQTRDTARGLKDAADEALTVMADVRTKMQVVVEHMLNLSEQTQQIGEIIAAVNDLADQSNLLALNAAIEAARAGEQGKGFAVVAGEIRNLADQSKDATTQVRTLLTDIQRATSAAAMATEAGTKGVDGGVERITQATEATYQITVAVQQHALAMEQITAAMTDIERATTQNLAATRDTQQAAAQLSDVAMQLKLLTV